MAGSREAKIASGGVVAGILLAMWFSSQTASEVPFEKRLTTYVDDAMAGTPTQLNGLRTETARQPDNAVLGILEDWAFSSAGRQHPADAPPRTRAAIACSIVIASKVQLPTSAQLAWNVARRNQQDKSQDARDAGDPQFQKAAESCSDVLSTELAHGIGTLVVPVQTQKP